MARFIKTEEGYKEPWDAGIPTFWDLEDAGIAAVQFAEVGQIPMVAEVNEDGRPVNWTASNKGWNKVIVSSGEEMSNIENIDKSALYKVYDIRYFSDGQEIDHGHVHYVDELPDINDGTTRRANDSNGYNCYFNKADEKIYARPTEDSHLLDGWYSFEEAFHFLDKYGLEVIYDVSKIGRKNYQLLVQSGFFYYDDSSEDFALANFLQPHAHDEYATIEDVSNYVEEKLSEISNDEPVILEWTSLGESNPNYDVDNVAKLTSLRDSALSNVELYLKTDSNTYYKCVKYVKQSTMIEVTFEGEGKRYEIALYGALTQCTYSQKDIHATTFNEFNNTDSATMMATAAYIKAQIEASLLIDSEVIL